LIGKNGELKMKNEHLLISLRSDKRHFQSQIKIVDLKLENVNLRMEIDRLEAALQKVNRAALAAREELKIFHPDYESSRIKDTFDSVFDERSLWDELNKAGAFIANSPSPDGWVGIQYEEYS
jgi:uncharacterized membrane protein